MQKAIFSQTWGGLGDNLCFSTLPERYNEIGIDFYLYEGNKYRNEEIYDLVWGHNPFVKGITSETPNIGANVGGVYFRKKGFYGENFSEVIETTHGFKPKNKYPVIYYKPKLIASLQYKTIINLTSISGIFDINKLKHVVGELSNGDDIVFTYYENHNKINKNDSIHNNRHSFYDVGYEERVGVTDIFNLCDILHSAKKIITLYSGTCPLSSAIIGDDKKECYIITNEEKRHSIKNDKSYYYDNLKYIYI